MLAREAVQRAEDAREIAIRRQEEEQRERERQAAPEREQAAREAAEEEARRRQEAEQRAAAEQFARERAEQLAAERDELERALREANDEARDASDQLRQTLAVLDERTAEFRIQREQWEEERQRREQEEAERARRLEDLARAETRVQLQGKLNQILTARDAEEGLAVTISASMFAPGSAALTTQGREQLALAAGVLLAHQDLSFRVSGQGAEGAGLARGRADTIRAYLAERGLTEMQPAEAALAEKPPAAADGAAGGEPSVEVLIRGEAIGYPPVAVLEQSRPF